MIYKNHIRQRPGLNTTHHCYYLKKTFITSSKVKVNIPVDSKKKLEDNIGETPSNEEDQKALLKKLLCQVFNLRLAALLLELRDILIC
jgi:hypothetical protein